MEIYGNGKKMLFVGNYTGHTKGHLKTPRINRLVKGMKQKYGERVLIKKVNEFRTSKLCSFCFKELVFARNSKFRLVICSECTPKQGSEPADFISSKGRLYENEDPYRKKTRSLDRDINGARNILYKGKSSHEGNEIHENFQR